MNQSHYGPGCKMGNCQSGKCTKKSAFNRISKTKDTKMQTQIRVSVLDIIGLNWFLSSIIFKLCFPSNFIAASERSFLQVRLFQDNSCAVTQIRTFQVP